MNAQPSNKKHLHLLLACLTGGAIVIWAILIGSHPLVHDDLFFHLLTGEIVLENGTIPVTDVFSYTRAGTPWVSHEWGFGLICYLAFLFGTLWGGGLFGLIFLKIVLILLLLFLLTRLSLGRSTGLTLYKGLLMSPFLVLAFWSAKHTFYLKASLFSSFFLILTLLMFQLHQTSGKCIYLCLIAGITCLWANIHCGVIFGLFVAGLYTLEAILNHFKRYLPVGIHNNLQHGPAGDYVILMIACICCALINANGIDALLYPFRLNEFLYGGTVKLQMGEFAAPTPSMHAGFFLIVAFLLGGLIPFTNLKKITLSHILLCLTFFILALRSNRLIADFALISVPMLTTMYWGRLENRISQQKAFLNSRPFGFGICTVSGVTFLVVMIGIVNIIEQQSRKALAPYFPVAATNFLLKSGINGHIFNYQNFGGYIHWRTRQPIYWDGRNIVFSTLLKETQTEPFPFLVKKYAIDHMLLVKSDYEKLKGYLHKNNWGLVYWDDSVVIYLARLPKFASLLDRYEYKIFQPFGADPDFKSILSDSVLEKQALAELQQALTDNPENQTALFYRGMISLYKQKYDESSLFLERALEIKPHYKVYILLAFVKARLGDKKASVQLLGKALKLQPANDDFVKRFLGQFRGQDFQRKSKKEPL